MKNTPVYYNVLPADGGGMGRLMSVNSSDRRSGRHGFLARLWRYARDRRGNIGVITALMLIPLIGTMGVAAEASSWFMTKRSMQNAADSAAIAYASNIDNGTALNEARAVAASYGYVNNVNNTLVAPFLSFSPLCSGGVGTGCLGIQITKRVPVYLAEIVGFSGPTQTITVQAAAHINQVSTSYCLFAINSGGGGISGTGVSFNSCNIRSNAGASCGPSVVGRAVSHNISNTGCGGTAIPGFAVLADPYASLATNIPANTCGSYSVATINAIPDNVPQCGGVKLGSNIIVGGPPATLVIVNGNLDLNGFNLLTNGGGLTVIFTGTTGGQIAGAGTLNISAPNTGVWSGVAVYQDPTMPASSFSFGSPTWDITGLVYYPQVTLTFNAPVSAPSSAYCFVLAASAIDVTGGGIYSNAIAQCAQAGLVPPTDTPSATNQRIVLIQ